VFADEVAAALTVPAVEDANRRAREARKQAAIIINPATGGKGGLGQFIVWKRKQLEDVAKAFSELTTAAGKMTIDAIETHVVKVTGASINDATAPQLRQATEALTAPKAA
jgi:hypothetical protein